MDHHDLLRSIGIFRGLADEELDRLDRSFDYVEIERGRSLVDQGDAADELFLVLSGRFLVTVAGTGEPIAEIAAGSPVGEIAFFAGGTRTATVTAARDSVVLRLGREQFDALARDIPGLPEAILKALAERLSAATARLPEDGSLTPPRTIAVVPAGGGGIPPAFLDGLKRAFEAHRPTPFLTAAEVRARAASGGGVDGRAVTTWLNERESRHDCLVYVTDPDDPEWSMKALRQADQVLLVAAPGADRAQNDLERSAFGIHRKKHLRLVLTHEARDDVYEGTAAWLDGREVFFHHHVALPEAGDYRRLRRFVTGDAVGFVACGGGAYCAAHVGVYHALLDAGIELDIFGGSSGGGGMAGAFARQVSPEEVDQRTHEIFVRRRAMRHLTIPRYGLLDHKLFDQPLKDHYGYVPLEDFAIPFFALSTNLGTGEAVIHRRGPHWEAVRATSSIPGLLPPFITREGELLVDGCLLDNVPLGAMRSMKSGPNIVVEFPAPREERCPVKYEDVPGRRRLLAGLLGTLAGRALPDVPGIPTVVLRSIMLHGERRTPLLDTDLLLQPPLPPDMGILEWKRHSELAADARAYTKRALAAARDAGHAALEAGVGVVPGTPIR